LKDHSACQQAAGQCDPGCDAHRASPSPHSVHTAPLDTALIIAPATHRARAFLRLGAVPTEECSCCGPAPLFSIYLMEASNLTPPGLCWRGSSRMRARVIWALSIAALLTGGRAVVAQRSAALPDLQGTWNGSTLTPLQRPQQFR